MNLAVIDLGTNTFNLLIFEESTGKIIYNDKIAVKLGKGGLSERKIQPEAYQRGLDAMQQHLATCQAHNVAKVYAFATSAVRSSTNGPQFAADIERLTGVHINIIDGTTEASIIYEGVKNSISDLKKEKFLVMDIGGGSTEFIIGNSQKMLWKQSYAIGGSRLIETFKPHDPPIADELGAIRQYVRDELEDLFSACDVHHPEILIGSSGSFDTFADMIVKLQNQNIKPNNGFEFPRNILLELLNSLLLSNQEQRLQMPGMEPFRADTIHMSALQLEIVLHSIPSLKKILLSTFALKEGIMFQILNNQCTWQESSL
ncbi:hypothetical protein JCM31826_06870 [Thermaurantimonas aggregans]|uniref:Ppx/GppA phosphatase N-terminal domain-containing protein n=1 Tax=Thermaurantimonas aggregans TaxID=2173829 RepID=A0A401XJJ8_9FLAO|nr:exopolyphosphatase [Thermaurantimonas aggregans]MCX8148628.1 hypothetical protein [Thermaurantimonas aggregans]GCD77205.1 hypothetical protein JCM31826_06870 [Thermaurantimonas aggregans]